MISYLVVNDSKAVPESPLLFKHLTCATKSKIWGRSELPTEHLPCDSQGLPALCSCRELLSPLILAEEQHQVCQEPLPPFSSGRHRWNTPLKHIGEGRGEMQTSPWDVGRESTLWAASPICKPCRRALAAILSPAAQQSLEGKLSVQPASELNAKIHILLKKPLNPPVTRSPAGFSAGFVSLGQK